MDKQRHQDRINININIKAYEVRVISSDGTQIGILPIANALQKSKQQGLDLVEVSPKANPPVCKIMDYGKYKYELTKKLQGNKKKQRASIIKEIKIRPKIDVHDLETKVKHIKKFITNKDKVKVTLVFRGREIILSKQAKDVLIRVGEMTNKFAHIEQHPKFEGKTMTMILSSI